MEFTLEQLLLVAVTVLTGLAAGLCFTWSNAVTPGIGRLDDLGYLQSFQQMNRAILNPTFFIVFFGPFILNLINLYVFRNTESHVLWLLITASALYIFGVVLVTIFGNVPLNELLDKTDLSAASGSEIKILRERFELKWNRLHLIRTITSITSFTLLLISILQISKTIK